MVLDSGSTLDAGGAAPNSRVRDRGARPGDTAGDRAAGSTSVLDEARPGSHQDPHGPWSLLASAVSEDLRASLALVGGYSQTLLHLPLDEAARDHHVAGLLAATGAVAQAAQEVLDLVQATAGRPGLHRRPVTADWLLGRLGRAGTEDSAGGIGLDCRAEPGLPLIEVDPAWVTHALRILVMHVQRHPAAALHGVTVHVHGNVRAVVISVRTPAAGPDPAEVPHLPRPLPARGEGGDEHLLLCRQIVEAHGGSLRLDETLGRCFATVSLPALRADELSGGTRSDPRLR